jgi:hypothetical protein
MSGVREFAGNMVDVAIIGAGPYGLSIAAHLKALGIGFRIFGSPMKTWQTEMPQGMLLKSEGFASSLYDPGSKLTLEHFCKQKGTPYSDIGLPVPLETFISYGLEFQKKFVPELEDKQIVSVGQTEAGFEIGLDDGNVATSRRLVIAVGISHFAYLPPVLSALSNEFVTHSSQHRTLDRFKGREVIVVGAGASALDIAALLSQAGISVQIVARTTVLRFLDPPRETERPLLLRIRQPLTGIGTGWRTFFYANAPFAFHHLPERFRLRAVKQTLGPAAGWFIKDQVIGKVPSNLGVNVTGASIQNGRISLELTDVGGGRRTLQADHVIAATGYKVDLSRLTFLHLDIHSRLRSVDQTPILSSTFESSVPGLYFVGPSSANAFGPIMRFAFGARFTAQCISKHLSKVTSRKLATSIVTAPARAVDRSST